MSNLVLRFMQKIFILALLFCDVSLAHNTVYILTSNFFNNINNTKDAFSIKMYLIILTSIGIMIFIILLIYCLIMYSKNIKLLKPLDANDYSMEYEIPKNTSFRDSGVQCDSINSNSNSSKYTLNINNKDEQIQNETDNRKKISLRIKTNRRKLHPVS